MKKQVYLVLFAVCMLATGAGAADYSPALDAQLAAARSGEFVSAIVILESPIDIMSLDFELHARKASLAERHGEVIGALKYNAEQTQPAFRAELEQARSVGAVRGLTAYWIENLFVVSATKEFLETLRDRGDIKYVTDNFRPELIEPIRTDGRGPVRDHLDTETTTPGQDAIRATEVNRTLGITGNGVLVANCDTGVDRTHPALMSRWRGNTAPAAECWRDAAGFGDAAPADWHGHGTHVMGTICGRAISGADTVTVGSAPNALWIASNSINQGVGTEFDNDILGDYQWFADPDGNTGTLDDVPDVIQNSWGVFTGLGYAQCFDLWNTVITNCEAAGPVVTWSAGNESTSGLRSPAIYSLNAYQIFSVGAVDATNSGWPYPLAWFSSQGPTPCAPAVPDNFKPEISAPGVDVYSSIPGGGYDGTYSGTSMAGPHVAGVVALMREACPDCDHITIKDAIIATARDLGAVGQDNEFGHGFIDAYDAVLAVSTMGRICGVVTDASSAPIAGARVGITTGSNAVLTAPDGSYCIALPEDIYTLEVSAFGYISQSFSGLTVVEGDTVSQDVVLSLAPVGTVSGTVTDCNGGAAVGATVAVLNVPIPPTTTDGAGFYSITLPQGTYDMRASGAGCAPHVANGVAIGASTTQDFTLLTDPRYLCSVADPYGYTMCEDVDTGGAPFNWQAITPSEGGSGMSVGLICGDCATGPIAFPFPVQFYGTTYNDFYITTKGYITFDFETFEYLSACFPADWMPAGMYCFWDDLTGANPEADIATYYDATNHWFVISWHNVGHFSSWTTLESFQIIIYDQIFYSSATGDNNVLFQYQLESDGAGITTGLKTASGGNFSQYDCDGTADASSFGVETGRSVFFSTGPGCDLGDPVLAWTANNLDGVAPLGGSDAGSVQICNSGPCPLHWSVTWEQTTPALAATLAIQPTVREMPRSHLERLAALRRGERPASEPEAERGTSPLDAQGGPDEFGYRWIDSDEPGGPVFNWLDLDAIGTNTGMSQDFETVALTLPWTFEFYGVGYNTINVSTKGNAHFGAPNFDYFNTSLPNEFAPLALLAPFWDDIYLPASGQVFYYDDAANNRFIIEWDDCEHYPGTGDNYNFQIILYSNGRIVFQYDDMGVGAIGVVEATVGIQNESGTVGLEVVYNAPYLHNEMAIEIAATPTWLTALPPYNGTVDPGQCVTVDFLYEAGDLPAGVYTGDLVFTSSDPTQASVDLPVTFSVGAYPAPQALTITYLVSTNELRFDWVGVGAPNYSLWSAADSDGPYVTLVGTTPTTSLTVPYPGIGKLFYIVTASN
ncbi:MAG: S8 family serine peptidase [bacterium]|nr:S8 family serine peptidase [bacterium]